MAVMKGLRKPSRKEVEYELTPDGKLLLSPISGKNEAPGKDNLTEKAKKQETSEKAEKPEKPLVETHETPSGGASLLLDLLASRADYFSEDAMEFILSAIDSGVDERAVKRMIFMNEEQLLQICGDVG